MPTRIFLLSYFERVLLAETKNYYFLLKCDLNNFLFNYTNTSQEVTMQIYTRVWVIPYF